MPLIEAIFGDAGSLGLGFEAESAKAAPKIKEIKTGTQAVQHMQLAVGKVCLQYGEVGSATLDDRQEEEDQTDKMQNYATPPPPPPPPHLPFCY